MIESTPALWVLVSSAALIGLSHTILVPDHYLPFIVLARSERWSWRHAIGVTVLCGLGRAVGAVLIGLIAAGAGGALGLAVPEGLFHGQWSAWALIIFGLAYAVWGLFEARRAHHGSHSHLPPQLSEAVRHESHDCAEHSAKGGRKPLSLTPWLFFIVFLLGPCKVILLGLILPAVPYGTYGIVLVALAFGLTTLIAMVALVVLGSWGLGLVELGRLERWSHALAGLVILASGVALFMLPAQHEHGIVNAAPDFTSDAH